MARTRRAAAPAAPTPAKTRRNVLQDKTNSYTHAAKLSTKLDASKVKAALSNTRTKSKSKVAGVPERNQAGQTRSMNTNGSITREDAPARQSRGATKSTRESSRPQVSLKAGSVAKRLSDKKNRAANEVTAPQAQDSDVVAPRPSSVHSISSDSDSDSDLESASSSVQSCRRPMSETPSAIQHSILALKNFKRRPRQPSMLNMVKQRLASARTSLAADSFMLKGQSWQDDIVDDDDDFLPDAAGTPMISATSGLPDIVPMRGIDLSLDMQQPSCKRKRTFETDPGSTDVRLDRGPSSKQRRLSSDSTALEAAYDDKHSVPPIVDDSALQIANNNTSTSPVPYIEDMFNAEPADTSLELAIADYLSSPEDPSATNSQSEVYGPPLSQVTPPRQRQTRDHRPKPPLSSAFLQSLLPKRRKQVLPTFPLPRYNNAASEERSQFVLEDSPSIDGDVSEYAQAAAKSKSATRKKAKTAHASAHKGRLRQPVEQLAKSKRTGNVRGQDKQAKKYGRKKLHDKENECPTDEDDLDNNNTTTSDMTTMEDAAQSQELIAARRKFAEIDNWDMEFENISTEDSRTSSQGWR